MRIRVYQIEESRDDRHVRLESYPKTVALGGVDPSVYRCVFHGDIDGNSLDDVYTAFNQFDHSYLGTFQGHPVSISDVVEVTAEQPPGSHTPPGCYFCDCIGWRRMEFDSALCAEMDGVRVLMLLPGKAPVVTHVIDDLPHWQTAVSFRGEDSLIEITSPFGDGVLTVSNEEAKLIGMEGNRRINGQIYAGPVFLVTDNGSGNFCGLTDDQIAEYAERFRQPEDISPEEVRKDIGLTFCTW